MIRVHRFPIVFTLSLLAASFAIAAAQDKKEDAKPKSAAAAPRIWMAIESGGESWGKIVIELNEEKAPITVKNFLRYVDEGFYDGLVFHRVMPTFMIQGGGFTAEYEKKSEGLHEPIQNEGKNGLKNARGTIAMARTGDPHSGTCQFFINVVDNARLDDPGTGRWGYCVFGKVVEGMDVVDRIRRAPTRANRKIGGMPSPLQTVVIKKAARVNAEAGEKGDDKKSEKKKDDGGKSGSVVSFHALSWVGVIAPRSSSA